MHHLFAQRQGSVLCSSLFHFVVKKRHSCYHYSVIAHSVRKWRYSIQSPGSQFCLRISKMNVNTAVSMNPLVAVCQMTSRENKEENFQTCKSLIEKAKARGAQMVFLPECFDHINDSREKIFQNAEPITGELINRYQELSKENSIWLSLGGFHEKDPEQDPNRVHNSHIIIASDGSIAAVYRKVHLFDVDIPGGVRLRESDFTIPGKQVMKPVETPVGKVGLGICYDLRFPEFSTALANANADILTYPSAFTQTTGMAHWEPLLRARAIENQCYVIAAAQTGRHNAKRASYGRAMVVDPWGEIVACCHEGVDVAFAEIDASYVSKVRMQLPVRNHKRPDLYGSVISPERDTTADISSMPTYAFGPVQLTSSQLFYKTQFSMAFVNKKPVLPGHVLVAPLRIANRLSDLSAVEVADLFSCVQKVQRAIEDEFKATSSTVAVQDGPEAGQSIPHVHVHILPRKKGDFERNDEIYYHLEKHDKSDKFRNENEMAEEATRLRKHFSTS